MRVLVIQGGLSSGLVSGEEVVVSNDVKYLEDKCSVHFENIKIANTGYRRVIQRISGITWSIKYYWRVKKLIRLFRPDIIHFHTTIPYLSVSVLVAAFRSNVPVVQTMHNARWLCVEGGFFRNDGYCDDCVGSYGWKGAVRGCGKGWVPAFLSFTTNLIFRRSNYLHKHISRFIAVSDFVRDKHVKSKFPDEKVVTRKNGFAFVAETEGPVYEVTRKSGITYAGRLSVAKGSEVLKHLIKELRYEINIIGNGPEEKNLEIFCKSNGIEHVKFWGSLPNDKAIDIIRSSRLSIVPSQCGDSFPTAALESIAVGTPVVAASVGGLPELVEKSRCGRVVKHNDFDAYSDEINRLYTDTDALMKMAEDGRKYVKMNLSMKTQGDELIKIYQNVISESHVRN